MTQPTGFPLLARGAFALLGLLLATCQPVAENERSTALPPPASDVSLAHPSGSLLPTTLAATDAPHVIALEPGEALHVEVEEHHLDVTVELYDPAGQKILTFDSPTGGHGLERVCFVAHTPGKYRLHVRAPAVATGSYRLTRLEVTAASTPDRDCWQATQLFSTAEARRGAEGTALIPHYRQAAQLWERAGAPYREAIARVRLGDLYFALGDLEEEVESYRRALGLLEKLKNRTHEQTTVMRLLANARWRQGRIDETETLLSKALTLAHESGDLEAEIAARDNLALLKKSRGEAHLAVRELKQNLEIWQREGRRDKEAESLHFLGQIYAEDLSKFPEAIDFLDQALEIWQQLGRTKEQAGTLILRGWASYRAGDPETAVGFFEAALRLAEASGHHPSAAAALDRLGTTYRSLGRLEQARSAFERSLEMSRVSGNLRNRAHTEANLGLLLIAHGEAIEGKAHLEQALEMLHPLGDRDAVAQVLVGLATVERTLGNLAAALRRYQEAMAQLDSLRLSARSQGGRLAPDPIWQEHYEGYVDLLIEVAHHDGGQRAVASAFEIAELNRSRNLYEILLEAGIELRDGADPELLRRERALISQIDAIAVQQSSNPAAGISQRLRALGLDLEEIRDQIRLSNPRFVEIRDPPQIELAQIQALLGQKTHLLSIVLGQRRSFIFQVSRESIDVRVLGARSEIERQARAVYAGLVRRAGPGKSQVGLATRALSDQLLGSLGLPPDASRLVIVTDGALAYVPFAALPRPDQPEQLLIDAYDVVQMPSAAILVPLVRRSATRLRPAKELAIFAEPVFSPDDPRIGSLARPPDAVAAWPLLGPIPHTADEARGILELYPEPLRLAALGFDARLDRLHNSQLRDYRILHFATHAVIDEEHPGRSQLVLSRFDRTGAPLNGALHLDELYTLDLPADLVVLSACRTALGQPVRGNGLVGLTHGFLYAGASRLVVSLWDVHDKATAELMTSFHRQLRLGNVPPDEALRRAQLELRQNPQYALPYYWAGFIFQGEWNPLPNKTPGDGN